MGNLTGGHQEIYNLPENLTWKALLAIKGVE
jgi:hypothetical protein